MPSREELRKKLKTKIEGKQIDRLDKKSRTKILDDSLKNMGIDKERLLQDIKEVNKQGGLEINKKLD